MNGGRRAEAFLPLLYDEEETMDNITFAYHFLEPKRTGNFIRDLNPLSKLNLCLILGLSAFFVGNYRYGFAVVLGLFVVAALSNCLKSYFSVYWKVMLLFGVFLFLVKAGFSPGEHMLFQLWGIHVSTESIEAALKLVSGVLAFSGAVIIFVQITEWEDLTYSLEQKGVSHMVSFVILSSFQTISDLGVNARVIMDSQKARGIETDGNVLQRAKAYIPVIGPLVLNAISSVEEKSIAMDARAFSAPVAHSFLSELPKVKAGEKIFVAVMDILFVLLIIWRIASWVI